MKKQTLVILIQLLAISFVYSQQEKYSRVKIHADKEQLSIIASNGICIDHGQLKENSWLITEIKSNEIAQILNLGIEVEILVDDLSSFYSTQNKFIEKKSQNFSLNNQDCLGDCQGWAQPQNFQLGSFAGFFTLQEVMENLDSMHAKFPQFVTARQAIGSGTTHEGRSIYYIKISDNPSVDENEPEILYNSLHHAREAESISQLIYFMWYILENYNSDPAVQSLINNTELYFVPVVNPDGYEYNFSTNPNGGGMWRKNRRINGDGTFGVDLNRNYGYFWGLNNFGSSPNTSSDTYRGPSANSEPETQLMENFVNTHEFRLAVNNHTYSDVLIYPYGYAANTYTPDSAQFVQYGNCMTECNGFAFGTANQTVGYTANGTIDDWLYADTMNHSKVMSFTPEAGAPSDGFWPAINRIIPIAQNTMSQNMYAAKLVGKYAKAKSIDPLFVSSINFYSRFEFTRLGMEPGNFTVSILPLSSNILITGQPKQFNNTSLLSTIQDSIDITLNNASPGDLVSYVIAISNGSFSEFDTVNRIFGLPVIAFSDDCSSVSPQWTSTSWGVNTTQFVSAGGSLTESPTGNYSNSVTRVITSTNSFDLTDAIAARLEFKAKWMIEAQYDYLEVQGSMDNGVTWSNLCGNYTTIGTINQNLNNPLFDGYQTQWITEEMNLSDFIGQNMKLRFRFKSDNGSTYDGFYLDDVLIEKVVNISAGINTEIINSDLIVYPNPSSEKLFISNKNGISNIQIFDVTGKKLLDQGINEDLSIDIKFLNNGFYWIKFLAGEKVKNIKSFIINH
ncbi:MAG: M14 family zinc carboxypeptidase [Bacteroidota bacterium]|jgi:carboxypeptidase T